MRLNSSLKFNYFCRLLLF